MGEVYIAFDERLREQIAIKTIPLMLARLSPTKRRIVAEVQTPDGCLMNVCRIL